MFSGSGNSMSPSAIPSDLTGSWKFKMAAVKPEVLISQLLDKITTQFPRLQHAIEVLDHENVVVAVGTALLFSIEPEI